MEIMRNAILVATSLLLLGVNPSFADDNTVAVSQPASGKTTPTQAQAPAASTTGSAAPLSTSALAKNEERQLRLTGEAIKRTMRCASDLVAECTQPVEMLGEIDIIGTDVIPIMPATAEGFGTQYIAPRPKYINLHMAQLGQLVPILKDDLANIVIPEVEKAFAAPLLKDMNDLMTEVSAHFTNLQGLTASPPYNQYEITNEARGIHVSLKMMDELRRKVLKDDIKLERSKN